MRRLLVILVAALSVTVGVAGHAQSRHHHPRHLHQRAPASAHRHDLTLSPQLMRQMQRNLAAGGYLEGPIDGRLTPHTRAALAQFQREYHLRDTGRLDRPTAIALLGRDAVTGAYTLASTK